MLCQSFVAPSLWIPGQRLPEHQLPEQRVPGCELQNSDYQDNDYPNFVYQYNDYYCCFLSRFRSVLCSAPSFVQRLVRILTAAEICPHGVPQKTKSLAVPHLRIRGDMDSGALAAV